MSKGEFQKRIREAFKELSDYDLDDGEEMSMLPRAVLSVIVDARKEFPMELLILLRGIRVAKKHNVAYQMSNQEAITLLEWFEKWFLGESEK